MVDLEAAIRAYLDGENCEAAGPRHGVSPKRLARVLKERGLFRSVAERHQRAATLIWSTSPRKVTLPTEELVRRYDAGEGVAALARAHSVDRKTVTNHLKAAGVKLRSMSEQQRIEQAKLTPEQRQLRALEAHMSRRGRPNSWESLCKTAHTRQERGIHISPYEQLLDAWLRELGLTGTPQYAIGPFNADLAVGRVVIELHGGGWHGHGRHRERGPERLRYILDQGWNVLIIWSDGRRWPLGKEAAAYAATFAQECEALDLRGRYRVIGGDGREFAPGDHSYDRAVGLVTEPRGVKSGL